MPTTNTTPPYVIFVRGTSAKYAALQEKNSNALYFITDETDSSTKLYLGDKLIGSGASSLKELSDVFISEEIEENSILLYDGTAWKNSSLSSTVYDLIQSFTGASAESNGTKGLVPAPQKGEQDYYLKGDGSWAQVTAVVPQEALDKLVTQKSFSEWNAIGDTVLEAGTILIYTDRRTESGENVPDFKIADGIHTVKELSFYSEEIVTDYVNSLIQNNTTEEWEKQGSTVLSAGTIIVYSDRVVGDKIVPGIKIGDGVNTINDLSFFGTELIITDDNDSDLYLLGTNENSNDAKRNTDIKIKGNTIYANLSGNLSHSLTIGDYVFNGSQDISIPIYKGE